MKAFVIVCALVATLGSALADQCSSIPNEDKIDCVQHDTHWTVASCLAKGCCHQAVPGYPACFLNHAYVHEARCTRVPRGARRDCGSADTTEIECIDKKCCWEIAPGSPYCYQPDNSVEPETPTPTPSNPVTPEVTPTPTPQVTPGPTAEPTPDVTPGPTPDTITPAAPHDTGRWKGRGATVAFVEVEAEHAHHNGKVIGNDRKYGQLSSEASGRRAVTLSAVGQYVEFTMPIKANSVVVRYSIPDSADGKGLDATVDLLVDGKKLKDLPFTSRYGWYYGGYPFNNNPHDTNPHHFYDEVRTFLDKTYPEGTKVRVQVSSTSHSPTFTIDLADFELIGSPIPQPAGSLSVTDAAYGADPTGKVDVTSAFQKAVDDGRKLKKTVYIPKGNYLLYGHVILDEVTVVGAGPWYSVVGGRHPTIRTESSGFYGKYDQDGVGASKNIHLANFAIIGEITERDDMAQTNGLGGSMTNSVVDNLWIQHVKCGGWFDGKMDNFTLKNSRIVDTTADGVNFHKGVTNSKVENTFLRNLGDDGLAMWSEKYAELNNKFLHNTVALPILANNIAIYGGTDIEVSDNLVYDTITNGGGIHVANRYDNVRGEAGVHGNYKIYRNTLLRAGNSDFNWNFGVGAIWFSGLNEDIHANIHVKDCDIIDASYSAISFIEGKVFGVVFENLFVNGTGTYVLQIQGAGEATFKNVHAINVAQKNPYFNCQVPFKIIVDGPKTGGWYSETPDCGDIQAIKPQWPWNW